MSDELTHLGMPFALYKAPLETISNVVHDAKCTMCGESRRYLFGLSQNDFLVDPCQQCGEPIGLRIGWPDEKPEPTVCQCCATINTWPNRRARTGLAVCYDCLRGGRAGIGHETEVGHIDFAHALRGLAYHGRAEIARREGLETTVLKTYNDGSQSIGVRLPTELLIELVRTPAHSGSQREYWPYHCKGFMAYLGHWRQDDFEKQSSGHGREWFGEHMAPDEPWEDMWEWLPDDIGLSYVFQCLICGRHRVFVDSD